MWSKLKNQTDTVLLVSRVALGALSLCFHSWPALRSVIHMWSLFGSKGHHESWLAAITLTLFAVAQLLGSLCLLAGFWFRPACLFFVLLAAVPLVEHFTTFKAAEPVIEVIALYLILLVVGPGRFSRDRV